MQPSDHDDVLTDLHSIQAVSESGDQFDPRVGRAFGVKQGGVVDVLELGPKEANRLDHVSFHHGYPRPLLSVRIESSFRQDRLEQLDRVPGRVIDDDLFTADACNDIISEMGSCLPQHLHGGLNVVDLNRKSVPSTRLLHGTIGHWLSAPGRRIWGSEHKTKTASREHGKGGGRMHVFVEAQMFAVKRDGGIHIIDYT